MSYALRLRSLLGASVSKGEVTGEKSDLSLLWEHGRSPASSPCQEVREATPKSNILVLLSTTAAPPVEKKLYCAPRLELAKQEKKKEPFMEFAYSMVSVASPQNVVIPDEILDSPTFTFKGGDNQAQAWESFKDGFARTSFAVVSIVSVIFLFENGCVKAQGITGTANSRLLSLSDNLPSIATDKAFSFIDEWIVKERASIFSSRMFHYSTVTPVSTKKSEMQSTAGIRYRVTLSGCLSASQLLALKSCNPNAAFTQSPLKL